MTERDEVGFDSELKTEEKLVSLNKIRRTLISPTMEIFCNVAVAKLGEKHKKERKETLNNVC